LTSEEVRARLATIVGAAAVLSTPVLPDPLAPPPRSDDAAGRPIRERIEDPADLLDDDLTPAAVLVPLVLGPAPGVLLTRRTAHLAQHAGQVSFPGGRMDPEDAHPEATALREAEEEIGLDPAEVELVGRLSDTITGTGYRITPVLGLVPPGLALRPSPEEVEAVFELPIAVLLDPAAPKRRRAHYRGRWRSFWVWPHPDQYIWGATAAILVHLAHLLRGA